MKGITEILVLMLMLPFFAEAQIIPEYKNICSVGFAIRPTATSLSILFTRSDYKSLCSQLLDYKSSRTEILTMRSLLNRVAYLYGYKFIY